MDVITGIIKERGRYRVTFNDAVEVFVSVSLMRERPLSVGQPLDLEGYDQWLMVRQYRHALDRAVAYLAIRARSRHEVEKKLLQTGYRPCTVEMVLYKLEREHILDDAEFAQQWAESRAGHKLGRTKIARELQQKGVSKEDAETALASIEDEDQLAAALALAEKALTRSSANEDARKRENRILTMLVRRGFSWDTARSAYAQATEHIPCIAAEHDECDTEPSYTEALALARKAVSRIPNGEDRRKTSNRICSMLVRRGFSWDNARQAFDAAMAENE